MFFVWIAVTALLAAWSFRNHRHVLMVAIAVQVVVPSVASRSITGAPHGVLDIHPTGWIVLACAALAVITRPAKVLGMLRSHPLANSLLAVVLIGIMAPVVVRDHAHGLAIVINQIAVPYALFLWAQFEITRNRGYARSLGLLVVTLAAAESALSLAQWAAGTRSFFFGEQMSTYYWYARNVRQLGTLDHFLALSLLISLALPLTVNLRRVWVQSLATILLTIGVLLTQSRTGLILAVAGLVFLFFRRSDSFRTKAIALAGGGVLLVGSNLSSGVGARLANDGGSANVRGEAVSFFVHHIGQFLFVGGGSGSSYATGRNGGLTTSLENPFMMYSVDYGLAITVVYFGVLLTLVVRSFIIRGHVLPGARAAGLFGVCAALTYNSISAETAAATIMWIGVALALPTTISDGFPESARGLRADWSDLSSRIQGRWHRIRTRSGPSRRPTDPG